MLPTFIGIGVPRGGTTWLHDLLNSHPEVAMPQKRKEVHYFDTYYDKGQAWYESFFPNNTKPGLYHAVGEITPHYLFRTPVRDRIASMSSVRHLLLMLRDPVARAHSHYTWRMRLDNYKGSFEQFIEDYPEAIEWGHYAQPMKHWLEVFRREQFLILIHEQIFVNPTATKQRIAEFLGLDHGRFPADAGEQRINTAVIPRFGGAYRLASRTGSRLRHAGLDWLPNLLGRKLGLKFLMFGRRRAPKPQLDPIIRRRVFERFSNDVEALELLLGLQIPQWRPDEIVNIDKARNSSM